MSTDMTYCVNPDCAYYKSCGRSVTAMPNRRGVYSFANLGGQCARYAMQNESKRMGAEWILKEDDWWDDYAQCSECHDEYTVPEGGLNFKFCPNCGARMEDEGDA